MISAEGSAVRLDIAGYGGMIVRIVLVAEEKASLGRAAPEDLAEALEILAHHADIDIVIPGDEAFVPRRAYHCPSGAVIGDGVLTADGVDFLK